MDKTLLYLLDSKLCIWKMILNVMSRINNALLEIRAAKLTGCDEVCHIMA